MSNHDKNKNKITNWQLLGNGCYGSSNSYHIDGSSDVLDRVQYMAIRLITGNMRCTLHFNLEPEANIMPLKFRRALVGLQYMSRIYKIQNHITRRAFTDYHRCILYEYRNRKSFPLPVIDRLQCLSRDLNLPLQKLEKFEVKDAFIISNVLTPFSRKEGY